MKFSFIIISVLLLLVSCEKKELPTPEPEPTKPVIPTEKLPIITGIAPLTIEVGDTITLTGTGFGTDINAIKVYFPLNSAIAPKSVIDTKMVITVPMGALSGQIGITVNNSSLVKSNDAVSIVSVAPSITGYSPAIPKDGDEVTIKGKKLGNDPSKVFIQFMNGIKINAKAVTPTQITFILPPNASAGKLTVILENGTTVSINDFNATFPNAYIVKTIGISIIKLTLDENKKLKYAELSGEGNVVHLRAGTGNKMEFVSSIEPSIFLHADAYPDALYRTKNSPINNAVPPDTIGNVVLKLKGFNKASSGYNQLNVVLCKDLPNFDGFYYNVRYLDMKKDMANSAYNNNFIKSVFSGDIKTSHIAIAPSVSVSTYITKDAVIDEAFSVYSTILNGTYREISFSKLGELSIEFKNTLEGSKERNVGGKIKVSLVNVDKGVPTVLDIYATTYSNIKRTTEWSDFVVPADSVNHVFLRLTGFDAKKTGFNQLRLFLLKSSFKNSKGATSIQQATLPFKPVTMDDIKKAFNIGDLYCTGFMVQ